MSIETAPAAATNAERRHGRPRLIAAGFLFAFALSIVTVILTGLWVRSPDRDDVPPARDAWYQDERRAEPAPQPREAPAEAQAERAEPPG